MNVPSSAQASRGMFLTKSVLKKVIVSIPEMAIANHDLDNSRRTVQNRVGDFTGTIKAHIGGAVKFRDDILVQKLADVISSYHICFIFAVNMLRSPEAARQ